MSIWSRLFKRNKTKEAKVEERFILCIDGGGMRGIVPLEVLREFEKILHEKGFKGPLASAFDMISGTSTGGLIALCASCADDPNLDTLLDDYLTSGKTIFPSSGKQVTLLRQISSDKYPVAGIENIIKQWFGDKDMSKAITKTLIMSYDLSEGKEVLFRSWDDNPVSVFTAARATTSAPTYFAPLIQGDHIYVDGGIVANNPSVYAYYEAKKLWPECHKFTIVSLSTAATSHHMEKDQFGGILSWVTHISPMYITAQKQTCDYVMNNCPEVNYIRIDGKPENSIKMDETNPEVLSILKDKGREITEENLEILTELAQKLAERSL